MSAEKNLTQYLDDCESEYEALKRKCYDEIAKEGGYTDFAHLKTDGSELDKLLFDTVCEERVLDAAFSANPKSH